MRIGVPSHEKYLETSMYFCAYYLAILDQITSILHIGNIVFLTTYLTDIHLVLNEKVVTMRNVH